MWMRFPHIGRSWQNAWRTYTESLNGKQMRGLALPKMKYFIFSFLFSFLIYVFLFFLFLYMQIDATHCWGRPEKDIQIWLEKGVKWRESGNVKRGHTKCPWVVQNSGVYTYSSIEIKKEKKTSQKN